MTIFYLDTSALVKRYKAEEGSDIIDNLYDNLLRGHSMATSFLTVLEFVSAIRRLLKGNRISQDNFETIISTFSQELEPFLIRAIEDKIVADALNKVVTHALKSADSIQLSTVVELREIMKDIGEKVVFVCDDDVIRTLDNAHFSEGGIAVLKGNIAHSSIIKQTAVDNAMMVHSGPAKVFYTEKDLLNAIEAKKIVEGDVIVLPFQGPTGAPGMPEMLTPTDAIMGAGYKRVALITDGRFSGGTTGPCIGHIEMEAYNGGAIGAIKDGDIIEIDVPSRKLNVKLSEAEIEERLKRVKAPERKLAPLLESYREKFTGSNCYGEKVKLWRQYRVGS